MASNSTPSKTMNTILNKSSQHCCVPFCNSDARYNSTLHFHHFPKHPDLRKQWIIKIRRDEGPLFKISASTVVCSNHFKPEDYKSWTPVRKILRPNSIPSVFDWSMEKMPRRALKRKVISKDGIAGPEEAPMETSAQSNEDCREISTSEFTHFQDIEDKDRKIAELSEQLKHKTKECENLQLQLQFERFGIYRFSNDNTMMNFYTGFQTYTAFVEFYKCIEPNAQSMQSAYYQSSGTISLAGRKRCMLLIYELFMFLCRLRVGLLEQDLSVCFNCSLSTVSRKIVTWANFLYFVLGSIPIWLSKEVIQEFIPDCITDLYPNTRVIIDCTEIKAQQPSSLVLNSQLYSHYKGTNTFKGLLGIAPHGAVTFISSLYTGCISDVEITKMSGLLDLLEPGDDVMADKGFTIKKMLEEKGVTLNIPPFLSKKKSLTPSEIKETEQIAKLCIHIERMNKRIKENHFFDSPIPMSLAGSVNQLWTIACLLANFKGPIVQAWSQASQ